MNTPKTKAWIEENGVVAIKADMTRRSTAIEELLVELGNPSKGIPFLAVFPGDGRPPITVSGPVTQSTVLDMLEQAGPSASASADNPQRSETAMND